MIARLRGAASSLAATTSRIRQRPHPDAHDPHRDRADVSILWDLALAAQSAEQPRGAGDAVLSQLVPGQSEPQVTAGYPSMPPVPASDLVGD
jgi:hypothetical protein